MILQKGKNISRREREREREREKEREREREKSRVIHMDMLFVKLMKKTDEKN